jgi:hypothetical protein
MKLILFCASAPVLMFLTHLVINRYVYIGHQQKSPLGVCIVISTLVAALYSLIALFCAGPSIALYVLLANAALAYNYFSLFTLGETGRRLRILFTIHEKGRIDAKEYDVMDMTSIRLDRLRDLGVLIEKEGRYTARRGILLFVSFAIRAWGNLLFGDRTPPQQNQ